MGFRFGYGLDMGGFFSFLFWLDWEPVGDNCYQFRKPRSDLYPQYDTRMSSYLELVTKLSNVLRGMLQGDHQKRASMVHKLAHTACVCNLSGDFDPCSHR